MQNLYKNLLKQGLTLYVLDFRWLGIGYGNPGRRYRDCVHGTEAGTYTFLIPKQSGRLAAAPDGNAEASEAGSFKHMHVILRPIFENLGTSTEARIPILFLAANLGPHQAPYGIIAQSLRHGLSPPTPCSLGVEILTSCHTSSTKEGPVRLFAFSIPW